MKILQIDTSKISFQAKKENFDCNYTNKNGVKIFENVIRCENSEFLQYFYLPKEDIIYTPGMLDAYNNIKNPKYKKEIEKSDKIFMRFPELENAIKNNNLNGIRNGIKTLAQCKFCNRFHTLYLLASGILQDYDSYIDKYSRSIEFVKASEEYMPEIFDRFYTYFSKTQGYITEIKKIIKNPKILEDIGKIVR